MPVPFKEATTALQRIDLMMKELEQRKKDLKVAAERRGKLMIYVRHNKLTRADLSSVAYQLPKTRITRKDREANLVKKRARSGKDYPPKAELVPFGKRLPLDHQAVGLHLHRDRQGGRHARLDDTGLGSVASGRSNPTS